jgi:hypothetical protein
MAISKEQKLMARIDKALERLKEKGSDDAELILEYIEQLRTENTSLTIAISGRRGETSQLLTKIQAELKFWKESKEEQRYRLLFLSLEQLLVDAKRKGLLPEEIN